MKDGWLGAEYPDPDGLFGDEAGMPGVADAPHDGDEPAEEPQDGVPESALAEGRLDELHPGLPEGDDPHDEPEPDAAEPDELDGRELDPSASEEDPGGVHAEVGEALDAEVLHELTGGTGGVGAAASAGDLVVDTPADGAAAAGALGATGASAESESDELEPGLVLITVVPLLEKPALRSSRSIAAAAAASVPIGS